MKNAGVKLSVLYVEGCPHIALATDRVTAALDLLRMDVPLDLRLVDDEEQAATLGLGGSPTVLIDGHDPFPNGSAGLSCRLYATEDGLQGAPSITQLVEALRR